MEDGDRLAWIKTERLEYIYIYIYRFTITAMTCTNVYLRWKDKDLLKGR